MGVFTRSKAKESGVAPEILPLPRARWKKKAVMPTHPPAVLIYTTSAWSARVAKKYNYVPGLRSQLGLARKGGLLPPEAGYAHSWALLADGGLACTLGLR